MEIDLLQKAYSAENFRTQGRELIDLMANHLKSTQKGVSGNVINYEPPREELEYWKVYMENAKPDELFGFCVCSPKRYLNDTDVATSL